MNFLIMFLIFLGKNIFTDSIKKLYFLELIPSLKLGSISLIILIDFLIFFS